MRNGESVPAAFLLAVGIALAGWWVGNGFTKSRVVDRFVTVKGLSERDVEADVALWPIPFVATDDVLSRAQDKIETSKQTILKFLSEHGIATDQVELQGLVVNDVLANPYRSPGPVENRYIITQTLMVRSEEPQIVRRASQDVGELVEKGVVLGSNSGPSGGPTYLFTELTALKPEMIAEATANARAAAQQFAADSGSELGGIRQANQGVFVILPRNRAPGIMEGNQLHKTVRVVATIDYYLKD
jgi:hypothetical protein